MSNIKDLISEIIETGEENFISGVFSGVKKPSECDYKKVNVKPVEIKENVLYQLEYFMNDNKVIHENVDYQQLIVKMEHFVDNVFKQVVLFTDKRDIQILISKKGKMKVINQKPTKKFTGEISHNRAKNYILKEGTPYDFLIKLGICDETGKIFKKKYDKFKQLNKYLEFVKDSVDKLKEDEEITIIDFGCGKAYLTFALYHYLVEQLNLNVKIIGLDLKEDVIEYCNNVAYELGYEGLRFLVGDIRDYESDVDITMVVSLHACDVATDIALAKATGWNAKVIFAVPCCQHELFSQIKSSAMEPLLRHGIVKEKLSSLITDSIRGLILEAYGYDVAMMEFIDLEHTPKNILIKGSKSHEKSDGDIVIPIKSKHDVYKKFKSEFGLDETFIDGAFRDYVSI